MRADQLLTMYLPEIVFHWSQHALSNMGTWDSLLQLNKTENCMCYASHGICKEWSDMDRTEINLICCRAWHRQCVPTSLFLLCPVICSVFYYVSNDLMSKRLRRCSLVGLFHMSSQLNVKFSSYSQAKFFKDVQPLN